MVLSANCPVPALASAAAMTDEASPPETAETSPCPARGVVPPWSDADVSETVRCADETESDAAASAARREPAVAEPGWPSAMPAETLDAVPPSASQAPADGCCPVFVPGVATPPLDAAPLGRPVTGLTGACACLDWELFLNFTRIPTYRFGRSSHVSRAGAESYADGISEPKYRKPTRRGLRKTCLILGGKQGCSIYRPFCGAFGMPRQQSAGLPAKRKAGRTLSLASATQQSHAYSSARERAVTSPSPR